MTTRVSASAISEQTVRELSRRNLEPEWLLRRRLDAWRAFEAMPMPTGLEEEWRRTDLSGLDLEGALSKTNGRRPAPRLPRELSATTEIDGLLFQEDGVTTQRYLSPSASSRRVFTDLVSASKEHREVVEENLHSLVLPTEWKLQGLAAALWQGGALVYVPRGVEVELPLRYVTAGVAAGANLFNHLLIVAEEQSSVTVVAESLSPDSERQSLISGAVEIVCRPNARVRYFDIQRWGRNAYNFTTVRARLERGAQLVTGAVGLGGRLTRAKIEVFLEGEGSQAELIGVSFGDGVQHYDYNTLQDHRAPRTTSDLLFKAALDGRASEVWYGTVRIHKGASLSDANQTSRNLLLSDTAKAAPIPVLEIEQYDILRCSHGATAGPVDEEQLFYLESRGIAHDDAEKLLVEAFFQQVLDRIPVASVRGRVEKALARKIAAAKPRS